MPVIEEVLVEAGLEPRIEVNLVRNQKEAESVKFPGSPTVKFDGVDVDPMAPNPRCYSAVGCRIYLWKGRSNEFPPKDILQQALRAALEKQLTAS